MKLWWIDGKFSEGEKMPDAVKHHYNKISGAQNRIMTVPSVVETEGGMNRSMDVYSKLLNEKMIYLTGVVDEDMAQDFYAKVRFLESKLKPGTMVELAINSPGGSVYDGFVIANLMMDSPLKFRTVCVGMAASMGAFLLAAGDSRASYPETRIMIHQPLSGSQGQITDMGIRMKESEILKTRLTQLLAHFTGQPFDRLWKNMERDNYMNGDDAQAVGLVDEVLMPQDNPHKEHKRWAENYPKLEDMIYTPPTVDDVDFGRKPERVEDSERLSRKTPVPAVRA